MSSFYQCQYCKVFLTSKDVSCREKHATVCKILSGVKTEGNIRSFGTSSFRLVQFPHASISLQPAAATTTNLLVYETRKSQRKRVRKRFDEETFGSANDGEDVGESDPDFYPPDEDDEKSSEPIPLLYPEEKKHDPTSMTVSRYKFSCDKCPGKFYSLVEFNRHISVHNNPMRKLITCLICERVFNKRDSLNSHIAAHETAEAKEENLNLLECWPEIKHGNKSARTRHACKLCLFMCTNHANFLEHIRLEHGGTTSKRFPCRLDSKCHDQFNSIRELLKHAKSAHAKAFYGRLTWFRMTLGVYTGKKSLEVREELKMPSRASKRRETPKRKKATSDSDDPDFEDSLERSNGTRRRKRNTPRVANGETIIKVENMDVLNEAICNTVPSIEFAVTNHAPVPVKEEHSFHHGQEENIFTEDINDPFANFAHGSDLGHPFDMHQALEQNVCVKEEITSESETDPAGPIVLGVCSNIII